MSEDPGIPGESDVTSSNRTENGSRGRKRKTQWEIPGSYKKRFHQSQSKDNFTSWNKNCQKQVTESEHSFPAQKYNHNFNSTYNRRQNGSGQNYQTKCKKKKMNQGKKKGKNQHRDDRGPRPIKEEKPKFMTQEFKDQNTLLVEGRLVCRHFLFGRCIKEDHCQLEHFQGYNDIIKEGCKYYVRGFCLNGQSCPYMHTQSFPCKFFHKKGKCLQEGNCRFSHEPLNDITEKLLQEALEQEKAFYQLAKTNKEESSEQQADTQETKPDDENKNPDSISQPPRPSFYNSTDAEKEPLEQPDVTEQLHQVTSDADQPPSSSSNTQNQQEPVCYSVEAVLGPQLSRTFFSFSKTPASQDSSSAFHPQTSSDRPYQNQPKAPYSVEAVFSSYKSADNSSNSQTPDCPRERTVCYAPHVFSEKSQAPPFRKEDPHSSLRIIENRCEQTLPKSLSYLIPDSLPVLSHTSGEEMEGQKTCPSIDAKLLHHPEVSVSSRSREMKDSLAGTKPSEISPGQACLLKHPKPNLSKGTGATPDEPVITCNKRREAADVAVHHFELSNILPNFKKKHSDARPATLEHYSCKNSIISSSDTANQGAFSSESNKTVKRSFSSLFASPLTDSVTPGSNSLTAAMRPQQSADIQIPSLPFINLFASPLSENSPSFPISKTQTAESAATPCRNKSAESAASKSKQSDFPSQVRMHPSSKSSQSSKTENDAVKPPSAAVCSILSDSPCEPSSSRTNQNRPDVSSPKDTAAPSVLKSLFVQLRPYSEDREQKGSGQSRDQSAVY